MGGGEKYKPLVARQKRPPSLNGGLVKRRSPYPNLFGFFQLRKSVPEANIKRSVAQSVTQRG